MRTPGALPPPQVDTIVSGDVVNLQVIEIGVQPLPVAGAVVPLPGRRSDGYLLDMGRRPSSSSGSGQWAALRPERGVMGAMIALGAVWFVFAFGGSAVAWLLPHLVLTPRTALGREPWQLVTNGFIETDFIQLLLTAVMLIFFGNPLEQRMGPRGFWKIFIGGIVGGSLAGGHRRTAGAGADRRADGRRRSRRPWRSWSRSALCGPGSRCAPMAWRR